MGSKFPKLGSEKRLLSSSCRVSRYGLGRKGIYPDGVNKQIGQCLQMAHGPSCTYDHDIKQQAFRHLMVLECSESTQSLRLGLIISLKIRGLKLVLILNTVFGVQKQNMQYRYVF